MVYHMFSLFSFFCTYHDFLLHDVLRILKTVRKYVAVEAGEILLQHSHPRFESAATLLMLMKWRLGVDDLANDFVAQHTRINDVEKPLI